MSSRSWGGSTSLALLTAIAVVGVAGRGVAQNAVFVQEAVDPNAFILHEQQFDSWAFGNVSSAAAARENLESQLAAHVNDIERACELPPYLREKLELAGRGDVERFFDEVEQKRDELQGKAFDRMKIGEIYQELQPLQQRYNQGLFESDSLFAKTAATILDTDQSARYEEALRERRAFRYRAKIELFITKLGDSLGLTDDQRDQFVAVVMEQTRAPRRLDHQYDQYIVMLKIDQVPEEALRSTLGDAQWRVLSQHLEQARGMEQFLKTNGYLDEDEDDEDPDQG